MSAGRTGRSSSTDGLDDGLSLGIYEKALVGGSLVTADDRLTVAGLLLLGEHPQLSLPPRPG